MKKKSYSINKYTHRKLGGINNEAPTAFNMSFMIFFHLFKPCVWHNFAKDCGCKRYKYI